MMIKIDGVEEIVKYDTNRGGWEVWGVIEIHPQYGKIVTKKISVPPDSFKYYGFTPFTASGHRFECIY